MPISLQCPECGTRYQLPDTAGGRQAKCKCGEVLKVPAAVAETPERVLRDRQVAKRLRAKVARLSMAYGSVMAVVFFGIELHEVFQTGLGLSKIFVPWWLMRPCLAGGIAGGGVLILKGSKRGVDYTGLCSGLLCLFPFWQLFALGPSTLSSHGLGYYLGQLLLSIVIYSIPLGVAIWCWREKTAQDESSDPPQ